jgi:phosphopantothenoylcysteine decarboxylase/phosphopantothenate--cysteine ligase
MPADDAMNRPRILITAGPTHEPIDAVRYIGNRSSGRLGVALAHAAAARGWRVTLLLGPSALAPDDSRVRLRRFRTAADLEALLREEFPRSPADDGGEPVKILVMAAAVADYRPTSPSPEGASGKIRRSAQALHLTLEPTPDLLAGCAARRLPGQVIVGFALEPRERLEASAREKLVRKGVDLIVANPLEAMDSPMIEAALVRADGTEHRTPRPIQKERFAEWLLDHLTALADGPGARASQP